MEAAGSAGDFQKEVMAARDGTTRSGSAALVSGTPTPGERPERLQVSQDGVEEARTEI